MWKEKYDERELFRVWYSEFERVYSVDNCSFNVHTFHHLPEVRAVAPLTVTSAVDYESHYNVLKRSYRSGTTSTGQQALANLLLAHRYSHSCKKGRQVTGKVTEKSDDSWCYIPGDGVIKVSSGDGLTVHGEPVETEEKFEAIPRLNFNDILCFKLKKPLTFGPEKTYLFAHVIGKCVVADGIASVLTWNMISEN